MMQLPECVTSRIAFVNDGWRDHVPAMRPDEVLVFKQLDSRPDLAFVCPHTSFEDPTTLPDAPPRQSIDIRFLCVFPKQIGSTSRTGT